MNSNVIWFAKLKTGTSVEYNVENINALYLTSPMPNPAYDFVKTQVYFEKDNNIEEADIKVYNILGNLVSEKNQFTIDRKNNYSAEITWQCGVKENGVYIINGGF